MSAERDEDVDEGVTDTTHGPKWSQLEFCWSGEDWTIPHNFAASASLVVALSLTIPTGSPRVDGPLTAVNNTTVSSTFCNCVPRDRWKWNFWLKTGLGAEKVPDDCHFLLPFFSISFNSTRAETSIARSQGELIRALVGRLVKQTLLGYRVHTNQGTDVAVNKNTRKSKVHTCLCTHTHTLTHTHTHTHTYTHTHTHTHTPHNFFNFILIIAKLRSVQRLQLRK